MCEGRHALALVVRAREAREASVEPSADAGRAQLFGGEGGYGVAARAGARERRVVDTDGHAVTREAHIELKPVGPIFEGAAEGGQSILGCVCGSAAVSDDERDARRGDARL